MLVLRNRDGMANILHSREVVTKVDPLAMVAYGIRIILLIKLLQFTYPGVTQTWYADNYGANGYVQ